MNTKVNRNALQELLNKAIAHQHAGENDQAKALFEQALKQDTKNAVALYSLSAIESAQGSFAQALAHIERVVVSSPKFAQAHLAYSVILFNLGRINESLKAVQNALKLEPALAGAQAHLDTVRIAHASQGSGNTKPNNPEVVALNTQAITLQGAGQHAEAEQLFRQAMALDGKNFLTLYSLGVARAAQMDSPGALAFFSQACEVSPHLPLGHFAKAKTLHDLGLAEDALAVYDQAIAADPHYMEAYTNKAALLQAMNRHHDALLCLTAATDINPDHVRALEGQGQLLGQYKQYTLATRASVTVTGPTLKLLKPASSRALKQASSPAAP
jgi:tetratricopeptide (TPR) repeat protein